MRRRVIHPLVPALLLTLSVVPTIAHGQAQAKQAGAPMAAPKLSPELLAVRAALDKYNDPYVALRDGFFSTVACIDSTAITKQLSAEPGPGRDMSCRGPARC